MADVVSDAVPQVLVEIQSGGGLSLSAAGRLFPGHRGGESVDPSTVFRWITKGARTMGGQIVKLEAVRVGGRWLTSRCAVTRFVSALTSANGSTSTNTAATPHTATTRQRASEKAAEKLKAMGA